jgi:hypothetical protein
MMKSVFFVAMLVGSLVSCTKESVLKDDSSITTLDARGSGTPVSLASIPQSVKDFIAAKYAGYRIKEAQMELEDSGIQYKITILNGKLKKRLLFDANWMFIGEKL